MPCWDNCGYTWRAVGESTGCTRHINDGTVDSAQLTIEIIDIRYDTECVEESCYHEFDAIVKIYELYTGDASQTLVYENVDTFNYNSGRIYYKHNEWKVLFNSITESPLEVNIIIKHKELCPDCTHPYICDCEYTIAREQTAMTYAPAATNNPDAEWIYVKLLDIEYGGSSIRVEIEIWRDGSIVYTEASSVIENHGYIDISDSTTDHDWRVACNDTSGTTSATVQLCFNFSDTGGGSGSTGAGLVAAQYYDSTTFGWTCGCLINAETENPRSSDDGKNTAPTEIRLDIHQWQGTYLSTKSTTPLVTQTMLTPSEKAQNQYYWISFMWNTELPPGEYMWVLTCLRGPHDGSFKLVYVGYGPAQRNEAFVNGYQHNDFHSKIIGVTEEESYQKVISAGDTFGFYECNEGHSTIKVKSSDGSYNGAMTTEKGSNDICYMPCHLSTGTNLSFEEPDLAGWTTYVSDPITIERSEDSFTGFPTNGIASAKIHIPYYSNYGSMYQVFTFTNCTSLHDLHFDYYVPSSSPGAGSPYGLLLQVYVHGTLRHQVMIDTKGVYSVTITDVPTTFWLSFKVSGAVNCEPRTIYIDNIRFTGGGSYTTAPVGRVVGGSVVRTDV